MATDGDRAASTWRRGAGVSATGVRRGLVLGSGGMLGASWMIGALCALSERTGWDPRSAEVIVGTSAGSVIAALLGAGATPHDLRAHQSGWPVTDGPLVGQAFDYDTATGGAAPPRPRLRIGSGRLAARSVRHPGRYAPITMLSALLPVGRGSLDQVGRMIADLPSVPGRARAGLAGSSASTMWSPHPGVRVVAMDYDTGERVVFGEPGAPAANLAEAVVASSSIPGWFAPAMLGGRRYVDGGMWSATSVDLLDPRGGHLSSFAGAGLDGVAFTPLDELWVLAPLAARGFDQPSSLIARLERRYRRSVNRRLLAEMRRVRAAGTRVRLLCPAVEDLRAMAGNVMDPARRHLVLETALRSVEADLRAQLARTPVRVRAA